MPTKWQQNIKDRMNNAISFEKFYLNCIFIAHTQHSVQVVALKYFQAKHVRVCVLFYNKTGIRIQTFKIYADKEILFTSFPKKKWAKLLRYTYTYLLQIGRLLSGLGLPAFVSFDCSLFHYLYFLPSIRTNETDAKGTSTKWKWWEHKDEMIPTKTTTTK